VTVASGLISSNPFLDNFRVADNHPGMVRFGPIFVVAVSDAQSVSG
jgi:hypothetical protein